MYVILASYSQLTDKLVARYPIICNLPRTHPHIERIYDASDRGGSILAWYDIQNFLNLRLLTQAQRSLALCSTLCARRISTTVGRDGKQTVNSRNERSLRRRWRNSAKRASNICSSGAVRWVLSDFVVPQGRLKRTPSPSKLAHP